MPKLELNFLMMLADKTGMTKFGQRIRKLGGTIYGSKGTAGKLNKAKVKATDIASITGRGPILNHKVVSLDGDVHAGLLARSIEELEEIAGLKIRKFDVVYINFYALHNAINADGATMDSVIDAWDIGGPTPILSACQGGRIPVIDPADMIRVLDQLEADGKVSDELRQELIETALHAVLTYYAPLSTYVSDGRNQYLMGRLARKHGYGENPHQKNSALFTCDTDDPLALDKFMRVDGKPPGYVNDTDLDRLLQTITHIAATFKQNGRKYRYYAVGDKHGNACCASYGNHKATVLRNTLDGNPRAIYGGMIIVNFPIGKEEAKILRTYKIKKAKRLLDGVFAPEITAEAIEILKRPGGACKMLVNPALATPELDTAPLIRPVRGGFLMQPNHTYIFRFDNKSVERFGKLSRSQKDNLLFAAAICQTSNSNTSTLVKNRKLISNGTSRPDRVDANKLAIRAAREQGHNTKGSVNVNDAFFPYPDGPQVLVDAGITAVLTCSGSKAKGGGDKATKECFTSQSVTLIWIPYTEGRMFFGH